MEFYKIDFDLEFLQVESSLNVQELLKLTKNRKNFEVKTQFIDSRFLVSKKQIIAALHHMKKSFKMQINIARDEKTEFLLRLSGQHQIRNAIKEFGISKDTRYLMIICFGGNKKARKEELNYFLNQFNFSFQKIINPQLPFTSLGKLCAFYNAKLNLEELEKKVLEKIASIDIV